MAILSILVIAGIFVSACTTFQASSTESVDQVEDDHEDEDEHPPEEHEEGGHEVSEEAAEVPNPISATDESISIGAGVYASNCALCHGESGEGDGPAASGLATPPADLHEDHGRMYWMKMNVGMWSTLCVLLWKNRIRSTT